MGGVQESQQGLILKIINMSNSKQKNENHISFIICDFECLPEEITKQVGIEPTNTWLKDELRAVGKGKVKIRENTWDLESELPLTDSVERHLLHLLDKLTPHKKIINELGKKYYVEFSCGLDFYEFNPGINLDNNIIKRIAELNAKLDLDMYCLGENSI